MKRCTQLLLSLFASAFIEAQIPQLKIVKSPREDAWGPIRMVVEDYQGFLWVATANGVFKYDGYYSTNFRHDERDPNSIASNRIEFVYTDKDSVLYIGYFGAGIDVLHLPTNKILHYRYDAKDANSLSNDTVFGITKDANGYVWVGTQNGLNRYDVKTGRFKRYYNDPDNITSLSDNQVRVVFCDKQGRLWVGTNSPFTRDGPGGMGGLNRFDFATEQFTRYLHDPHDKETLSTNEITALFEDSKGIFWVGTSGDGLHTMDRNTGKFQRHSYDPRNPEKLSRPPENDAYPADVRDFITSINEDRKGRIWICTQSNGANLYDPKTEKVVHFGLRETGARHLPTDVISSTFRTSDGYLFINPWTLTSMMCMTAMICLIMNMQGDVQIIFTKTGRMYCGSLLWVG